MRKKFLFLVALFICCHSPEVQTNPFIIVSECHLPGYSKDIDIKDNLAYIANGQGGLQIIDIGNPESTFVIGSVTYQKEIQGVAVRDTFAYLAGSSDGCVIVNIADPTNPTVLGNDASFYAYSAFAPQDESLIIYIAASYWFIAEDVDTPSYPEQERALTTRGVCRGLYIKDSLAFLACEQMGLSIFDLSKPDDSVEIGWIDTPGNARSVFAFGNYAYVADGRAGMLIADPENNAILSVYDTPGYANDIYVSDSFVYIADGDGGVQVVNVSDPADPILYGNIETPYAYGIYVRENYIYVADRDLGLMIITEEEQ